MIFIYTMIASIIHWYDYGMDVIFVKHSILGNWPKKRAPEAWGKSSAKRERWRRESPPEAKGERSEPFAGGARDSAKRNRATRWISCSYLVCDTD